MPQPEAKRPSAGIIISRVRSQIARLDRRYNGSEKFIVGRVELPAGDVTEAALLAAVEKATAAFIRDNPLPPGAGTSGDTTTRHFGVGVAARGF